MTLPTFLGIGVPRGGTTWLHQLLLSHPEIFVPTRRKEIHFFTLKFENGLSWYEGFFRDADKSKFSAIGEISPSYFYLDDLSRFSKVPSIEKYLLILRDPVDRAFSYYGLYRRDRNYSGSFEAFLHEYPPAIQDGFYSKYLENYLKHFRREQILVLIQENVVNNVLRSKEEIASFLGVSARSFPSEAGTKKVNQSYVPRRSNAYALLTFVSRKLRDYNLDTMVNFGKTIGLKQLFGKQSAPMIMKEDTRQYLTSLYEDEVKNLETILQANLSCWKKR